MKQFKLKEEYNVTGLKVTKQVLGLGNLTFDLSKVKEEDFHKWVQLGFEELFDEIIETIIEEVKEEVKEVIENITEFIEKKAGRPKKLSETKEKLN